MVEHEVGRRATTDQLDRVGEMAIVDIDVEREPVFRQQFDAPYEAWLQAEGGVGLVLDDTPDSLDERAKRLELREKCAGLVAIFQGRPGNNRLQAWLLARSFYGPVCFHERVGRCDLDLYVDHGGDLDTCCVLSILQHPMW